MVVMRSWGRRRGGAGIGEVLAHDTEFSYTGVVSCIVQYEDDS
jgi:hypothetical protein